jgi:hypothetical protein
MGMSAVRNLKVWAPLLMVALAASVLMAVVIAAPAQAAPFSVTNTADSGEGSLRQAISDANASAGEDTINFDPSLSGQTITLGSQLPIADGAGLTIDGGSANITVSGNNAVRVLDVRSGAKLTLNNLTVANGRINFGGGIFNNGTLTVNNSTLSGNNANEDFGSGGGGGIWNAASGTATVSNSTLSGNSAQIAGGGIFNQGGTLTVSNSTLSGNSANNGGSLSSNGGTVSLKNTIVANSPSGGNCSGTITNGGYNLDSDGSCGFGTANNSLSGVDPKLGDLADNGGPTKTHALLEGSPAIDKGIAVEGITTDQRGVGRPQGAASDIGAFEAESTIIEDTIKPRVSTATPTGPEIGRGTNVAATFSEKMSPTSITKSTFKLFKVTSSGMTQVTNVTVTLSSDGLKATLNPYGTSSTLLAARTKYKAVVTTGAKDLAGNALDQNSTTAGNQQKSWTFTTKG